MTVSLPPDVIAEIEALIQGIGDLTATKYTAVAAITVLLYDSSEPFTLRLALEVNSQKVLNLPREVGSYLAETHRLFSQIQHVWVSSDHLAEAFPTWPVHQENQLGAGFIHSGEFPSCELRVQCHQEPLHCRRYSGRRRHL